MTEQPKALEFHIFGYSFADFPQIDRFLVKIIPVLDLMGSVIVRGIAGRRDDYRPIESQLARDPSPDSIARGLMRHTELSHFYLADLDAILGEEPAWETYQALFDVGVSLWIDAGVGDVERAEKFIQIAKRNPRLTGIVVGLESLAHRDSMQQILKVVDPERLIFSLDLIDGQPLTTFENWKDRQPLDLAREMIASGVRQVIVLDLARVGTTDGCATLELCRTLHLEHADLEIISGGGVRHLRDLQALHTAGCQAALVASALHDGRLTKSDLQTMQDSGDSEPRSDDDGLVA